MLRKPEELKILVNEIIKNPRDVNPVVVNETLRQLKAYYYEGTPVISDALYDQLEGHVKAIWPKLSVLSEVGARIKQNTVKLPYTLGSLNKIYNDPSDPSSLDWIKNKKKLIVSEKLDGSSVYIEFENGEVKFAATRGDSDHGADVTHKAKVFCKSFMPLDFQGKICLRGEMTLVGDSYKDLGMKNRRNGVVGVIKNEAYTGVEKVVVKFYELIDIFNKEGESTLPDNELDRWRLMESLNLPLPKWQIVELTENDNRGWLFKDGVKTASGTAVKANVKMLVYALEKNLDAKRKNLDYDIDGYVLADVYSKREDSKYPKNKIAFKKNAEAISTEVHHVEWNVSRTGRIVPLVYVEPIDIDGITVRKATGFNAEYIEKNGIAQGTKVSIVRSGDVIPYIESVQVIGFRKPANLLPDICPACKAPLKRLGVDLVCKNPNCEIQNEKKLVYFLRALDVEEMSNPTVRKLGWKKIGDAYTFDPVKSALVSGLGKRSIEVITKQIKKTLITTPVKLLTAFGISNCSSNTSESILDKYQFDEIFSLTAKDFSAINGIGDTIATNLVEELPTWKPIYEFLLQKGLTFKKIVVGTKLAGQSFCFTGKIETMKRSEAEKLVKSLGGKIHGVNKDLTYLVTNTPNSGSSKNKKANELGVKVITEEDFLKLVK